MSFEGAPAIKVLTRPMLEYQLRGRPKDNGVERFEYHLVGVIPEVLVRTRAEALLRTIKSGRHDIDNRMRLLSVTQKDTVYLSLDQESQALAAGSDDHRPPTVVIAPSTHRQQQCFGP